jgi:hypothetical protein
VASSDGGCRISERVASADCKRRLPRSPAGHGFTGECTVIATITKGLMNGFVRWARASIVTLPLKMAGSSGEMSQQVDLSEIEGIRC